MDTKTSIPLTQNKFTLIDSEDFEFLNQWKWHAHNRRGKYYASRVERQNGKMVTISMHRLLLNAPKDMEVDHINGDSLDNRRSNLRLVTRTQNNWNSKLRKDNKSGIKGVRLNKGRWQAYIQVNKKWKHLGYFSTKEEAELVYQQTARKEFGEYARY